MPRIPRGHLERGCFHVLNRGNQRQTLFHGPTDFGRFLELLTEAQSHFEVGLWSYCLMGNHWHLVVEVDKMVELSGWMHWITNRHVRATQRERRTHGGGHVYQGRYKSFPIQDEIYLYDVMRYVEANPVRAGLTQRGRDWMWSSLSPLPIQLGLLTVERPRLRPWTRNEAWEAAVDQPQEENRLGSLRHSVQRGTPQGDGDWVKHYALTNGLQSTLRPPGRPRKARVGA